MHLIDRLRQGFMQMTIFHTLLELVGNYAQTACYAGTACAPQRQYEWWQCHCWVQQILGSQILLLIHIHHLPGDILATTIAAVVSQPVRSTTRPCCLISSKSSMFMRLDALQSTYPLTNPGITSFYKQQRAFLFSRVLFSLNQQHDSDWSIRWLYHDSPQQ